VLDDYDAKQLSAAGIEHNLIRPVRESQLFDSIANCIGAKQVRSWASSVGKPPGAPRAESATALRRRILVVEDNDVNQEVAKEMLNLMGFGVEIAKDGEEAVRAVKEKAYDLVLMDCQMPVMDGFEATRVIRHNETCQESGVHLPIVALTADAVQGDREQCLAAGMDDYLAKPFTQGKLRDILEKWLLPRSGLAQPAHFAAGSGETPPKGAEAAEMPISCPPQNGPDEVTIDRRALMNIAALQRPGSPSILAKVISLYLQSSSELLAKLSQALESGDPAATRKAAHSLKSSSANVGARQLASLSSELEDAGRTNSLERAGPLLDRIAAEHNRVVAKLEGELAGVANA
jgi:CheY-like chemotaxis protein